MGVQALRYQADPIPEVATPSFQSKGEYYNVETTVSPPASLPLRSDFQNSTMKNSTKDMFGSDYFNNRFEREEESEQAYQLSLKKPSIFKKSSNGNSRFKETLEKLRMEKQEQTQEEDY